MHRTLSDINHSKNLYDIPYRVKEIKTDVNKWYLSKPKSFYTAKETIKLLEENIGRTLSDINHSKTLYDPSPRAMEIKQK